MKSPGEVFAEFQVNDESIFSTTVRQVREKLSVIYTDYTNIMVTFLCYENMENNMEKAHPIFVIYVRQRSFDSLSQFGAALQSLTKYGVDVNDVRFMNNSPSCKN